MEDTLEIIKKLKSYPEGWTKIERLTELQKEFGLVLSYSPCCRLVSLNYGYEKHGKITEEARQLIVEVDTFKVVGKSMFRLADIDELSEEKIEERKANPLPGRAERKIDGSIILVYFYDGRWRFNTRKTFAQEGTFWHTLISSFFSKLDVSKMDINFSYVFEIVSRFNRVLTVEEQGFYLLAVCSLTYPHREEDSASMDALAGEIGCKRPPFWEITLPALLHLLNF